jgi:hypothetical protein
MLSNALGCQKLLSLKKSEPVSPKNPKMRIFHPKLRYRNSEVINFENCEPSNMTKNPNDTNLLHYRRIVVNYTEDQEDEDIRSEDLVRPSNYRWCFQGSPETRTWKLKTTANCPTYGTCQYCFKAGPVGKHCNECQIPDVQALYVLLPSDGNKILDSITFAKIFNRGLETAKADRYLTPNMVRLERCSTDHLTLAAQHKYKYITDPVARAKLIRETLLRCYMILE